MRLAVACVDFQLVFLVFEHETPVGDAVGETAWHLARAGTVAIIVGGIGIAQDDVIHMAIAIGRDDAHDARPDVAQLHFDTIGIGQCVELNVFMVRGFAPGLYFDVHSVLVLTLETELMLLTVIAGLTRNLQSAWVSSLRLGDGGCSSTMTVKSVRIMNPGFSFYNQSNYHKLFG